MRKNIQNGADVEQSNNAVKIILQLWRVAKETKHPVRSVQP